MQLSRLRPMPYSALLQARTMPFPPTHSALAPCVALDPTRLEFILVASRHALGERPVRTLSIKALAPIFALSSDWEKKFLISSMAHCTAEAFNTVRCLGHSGMLDESPLKKQRLPQLCSVTNNLRRTLLGLSPYVLPEFLDQSVAFALRRCCST